MQKGSMKTTMNYCRERIWIRSNGWKSLSNEMQFGFLPWTMFCCWWMKSAEIAKALESLKPTQRSHCRNGPRLNNDYSYNKYLLVEEIHIAFCFYQFIEHEFIVIYKLNMFYLFITVWWRPRYSRILIWNFGNIEFELIFLLW